MSEHELSEEDVARHWNDNAASWARDVRQGNDIARERLNNPAFMAFIGDLRGQQAHDAGAVRATTRASSRVGART